MDTLMQAGKDGRASAAAEARQYLTFMLGGETFAIGILGVKEIIEYGGLTTVPMMPQFIRGVINLRGAAVPVVDLSTRFGGSESQLTRRTCIVIVESVAGRAVQEVGLVVDAVNEVLEIPLGEIEPPATFGTDVRAEFINGMGKVNEKFVIMLDVNRILSVDEMAALGRTAGRETPAAFVPQEGAPDPVADAALS